MAEPASSADPFIPDWLLLQRTVRFGETDAAGVMHFHQLLRWCHEAYEESLEKFGIHPTAIFPGPTYGPPEALPIVHCRADYWSPLVCGDSLVIELRPHRIDESRFELAYLFQRDQESVARGYTRHVAIDATNRKLCLVPANIERWLEASIPNCVLRSATPENIL